MDQYIQNWDRNKPIGLIFAPDDNLLKDISKAGINQNNTLPYGAKKINNSKQEKVMSRMTAGRSALPKYSLKLSLYPTTN